MQKNRLQKIFMSKKVNLKAIYSKIYKFAKDGLEEMTTHKYERFRLFIATSFTLSVNHRCE